MLRMLKPFIQRIGITILIHGTDESKWTSLHEIIDPKFLQEYQQICNDMLAKVSFIWPLLYDIRPNFVLIISILDEFLKLTGGARRLKLVRFTTRP